MEVVCIIEWNHVYTLEIVNILCDPPVNIFSIFFIYTSLYILHLYTYIARESIYNTTVKYVHFTMFYTGDGNDLIYPRCVPLVLKIHGLGTQVGAFIYNYTPEFVQFCIQSVLAVQHGRFVSISLEN